MAKYDFTNSVYNQITTDPVEGRRLLDIVLKDPDLLNVKAPYWPTAFKLDSTPIQKTAGKASFTVAAKYPTHAQMADMRAPLTDGRPGEEGQAVEYSGSIAEFIAPVYSQKAEERVYQEKMYSLYGNDAALIQGYAENVVAPRIESCHQTLDYLSVMAETTGKVFYDKGAGIKSTLYRADIPADQFLKAGAKVWTDPEAKILDYMALIEEDMVQKWGADFARVWKFDYDFFKSVVLANKQVQDYIKLGWLVNSGQLISQLDSVPNSVVTEENFNKYVIGSYPGLSPIKLVKVRVRDNGKVFNPWPDGVVTLSPAGYAGTMLRSVIEDEEIFTRFGNDTCSFVFSRTENGLILVLNSVEPDGILKKYNTRCMVSATPALEDFLYRVIVDTKTAN